VASGLTRAIAALRDAAGEAEFAFFVPGRLEVLGKHTDYAGGRSLLAALEDGVVLVGRRGPSSRLRVLDAADGREASIDLRGEDTNTPRDWAVYPEVVARRVPRDLPGAEDGATLAFVSTMPRAAGMSSSSALVVSIFLGVADALNLGERPDFRAAFGAGIDGGRGDRERLAEYLAAVEAGRPFPGLGGGQDARGVGTDGGSQDHVAILCGRDGHLVRYGFSPLRFEGATALPEGWTFVVADSGVKANKARDVREAYNGLAADARRIATLWRESTGGSEPHLGAILASAADAQSRLERLLEEAGAPALLNRLRQFATESFETVPRAVAALDAGNLAAFGAAVATSHTMAEDVLQNQVPETRGLVRLALDLGSPAASAFGAGFGGAVWALVRAREAEVFLDDWRARYAARFQARAAAGRFFVTHPGPAAVRIRDIGRGVVRRRDSH
jgi:galactokinase